MTNMDNETFERIKAEAEKHGFSDKQFLAMIKARGMTAWFQGDDLVERVASMILNGTLEVKNFSPAAVRADILGEFFEACSNEPEDEQPTPEQWVRWVLNV